MTLTAIMQHARAMRTGVLGCVADVRGSAYRQPGARVWIRRSGERLGMISGGCLDKDLSRHAHALTESGPRTVLYDTRGDAFHPHGAYGSGCDGIVEIFLERVDGSGGALLDALALAWSGHEALCVATIYQAPVSLKHLIGTRVGSHGADQGTMPVHR